VKEGKGEREKGKRRGAGKGLLWGAQISLGGLKAAKEKKQKKIKVQEKTREKKSRLESSAGGKGGEHYPHLPWKTSCSYGGTEEGGRDDGASTSKSFWNVEQETQNRGMGKKKRRRREGWIKGGKVRRAGATVWRGPKRGMKRGKEGSGRNLPI